MGYVRFAIAIQGNRAVHSLGSATTLRSAQHDEVELLPEQPPKQSAALH